MASKRRDAPPRASTPAVARRMACIRGHDNPLELQVRSSLHRKGLRFRVHRRLIPRLRRTVDIVFPGARLAVFIDVCFWHGCPDHGTWPKTNAQWWQEKIETNIQRDLDTDERLRGLGWNVVRVWEHEEIGGVIDRIRRAHEHALATASRIDPRQPPMST